MRDHPPSEDQPTHDDWWAPNNAQVEAMRAARNRLAKYTAVCVIAAVALVIAHKAMPNIAHSVIEARQYNEGPRQ